MLNPFKEVRSGISGDHEVLTPEGWKPISKLVEGGNILKYNTIGSLTPIFSFDWKIETELYSGKLSHYVSPNSDQLLYPDTPITLSNTRQYAGNYECTNENTKENQLQLRKNLAKPFRQLYYPIYHHADRCWDMDMITPIVFNLLTELYMAKPASTGLHVHKLGHHNIHPSIHAWIRSVFYHSPSLVPIAWIVIAKVKLNTTHKRLFTIKHHANVSINVMIDLYRTFVNQLQHMSPKHQRLNQCDVVAALTRMAVVLGLRTSVVPCTSPNYVSHPRVNVLGNVRFITPRTMDLTTNDVTHMRLETHQNVVMCKLTTSCGYVLVKRNNKISYYYTGGLEKPTLFETFKSAFRYTG